jgi:hypothetical protein
LDDWDEEKTEWCEHCDDSYQRTERGRVKGHCGPCSVAYRQAKRYGLTIPRMNAILRVQDDACPICGVLAGDHGMEGVSFWHVDHDHACCNRAGSCGRCVRGLLCKSCNMRGVAWYERLPEERRDWPRMNAYLADPPAQRPEARVRTVGDLHGIRGRDGAFADWRSSELL